MHFNPTNSDWLHPQLPWPLNYLPSIFRFVSLAYIAPIILLSVIDVGGYLLFKLFYKPFGYYPMYSYFKQAPPREDAESEPNSPGLTDSGSNSKGKNCKVTSRSYTSSSSEASFNSTSPEIQPSISIMDTNSGIYNPPDQRSTSSVKTSEVRKRHQKKSHKVSSGSSSNSHLHTVGFDGPMLDFKSPTASDYEE